MQQVVCKQVEASRQRGAVLAVSLIFLLLLTMIGLAAVQNSTLQERMAGSSRDINTAFQAAEAATREAEQVLQQATLPSFNGSNGLFVVCDSSDDTSSKCVAPEWLDKGSSGWRTLSGVAVTSRQPEYFIQKYVSVFDPQGDLAADAPPKIVDVYKVVARGFGVSDNSMVALEITYRRD